MRIGYIPVGLGASYPIIKNIRRNTLLRLFAVDKFRINTKKTNVGCYGRIYMSRNIILDTPKRFTIHAIWTHSRVGRRGRDLAQFGLGALFVTHNCIYI